LEKTGICKLRIKLLKQQKVAYPFLFIPRTSQKDDVEMARQVVWSYEATADLAALANYIARDSEFYKKNLIKPVPDRFRNQGR